MFPSEDLEALSKLVDLMPISFFLTVKQKLNVSPNQKFFFLNFFKVYLFLRQRETEHE